MVSSPVVLIVFNRPRHTAETFAVLQAQQPARLFIIADGPRPDHPDDVRRCAEVRAVVEQVDWPCEVSRDYAESNLGLKRRVSSGLDWVFAQVDRAIVLEDDCIAHPDFFAFCDELLERYADDERVWVVTGDNFQQGGRHGEAAYYFSKYPHCWGWATWRRAWGHYQEDIPFFEEWKDSAEWRRIAPSRVERAYWEAIFSRVERHEIDSWAYPWTACVWHGGGLTATPNTNLVTNIGFGAEATHTTGATKQHGTPSEPLGAISHPSRVERDRKADRFVFEHHFGIRIPSRYRRVRARGRALAGRGKRAGRAIVRAIRWRRRAGG